MYVGVSCYCIVGEVMVASVKGESNVVVLVECEGSRKGSCKGSDEQSDSSYVIRGEDFFSKGVALCWSSVLDHVLVYV